MYLCKLALRVIGSLPSGFIVVLLTARGVMLDFRKLSWCSLSCFSSVGPPTDMSAPKSGRVVC